MAKKEFAYRGYNLENMKKLSMDEFTALVDARKRRSLKRGHLQLHKKLLEKVRHAKEGEMVKTHVRDMIITPIFIGKTIGVHNGKLFQRVDIVPDMVGHYLGEFAPTRNRVKHSAPGVGATRASKYVSLK